ncbi:PREDICTED: putative transferase CAF17 homolog, mitochondrial isoform X1 [Papilio xuthus]|uniref:Transferase CAF17 homolog, mitochondrial isoform X1 n=1 Tax=Papilio xuthus TaxID=66420 RepID=A0AAJ7EBR7_PAPXU|nr:PREDICTED: putative transferase CAF17 homolog, mitochondrial isoform X1 [Papilio xuthus]
MMRLPQVKNLFCKRHVLSQFLRYTHQEHQISKSVLYPLSNRKLLNVKGSDASVFLQGLITNDMRHFEEGAKSMYAMFLNNKGRVMYDTLVYKWKDDSYLLECDSSVINAIQKHLKMFKLRRQLEIKDVNDEIKLWALISPNVPDIIDDSIQIYKDPRLIELGSRIISSVSVNETKIIDTIERDITIENDNNGYKYLRYKLGVSEGADDLPPGTSFPLEANCDYLHGVSFHKGCYIGQELTARVHHTGVVRKRLMPLKFTADVKDSIQKDCPITVANNTKTSVGKLKGTTQNYGLGLLRIKEAMDAKILKVGDYEAEVIKPSWWPIEAPREVTAKKEQN